MSPSIWRSGIVPGGVFVGALLLPLLAWSGEEPVPRYTYLGAGLEWTDAKCAMETESGIDAYTVEGSLGVLDFLHVTGSYFDGDTGTPGDDDASCYELGIGASWSARTGTDLIARVHYVDNELGNNDEDGFAPELAVRHMLSDRAEIQVGAAYYDVGEENNTEVRVSLVYNVRPWLALRGGGTVFDNDSSFFAGVRVYLGDNLF